MLPTAAGANLNGYASDKRVYAGATTSKLHPPPPPKKSPLLPDLTLRYVESPA
jgi:hypothetical protein